MYWLITYRGFCESWRVVVDISESNGCCSCVGQTYSCTVHVFDFYYHQIRVLCLINR